jgi:hypothetical protein
MYWCTFVLLYCRTMANSQYSTRCTSVLLYFWLLLLLLLLRSSPAQEPHQVVTLPCTVGWILPDARQVKAFRLYRNGRRVGQLTVYRSPTWGQFYQASCAQFQLTPGDHAIAVSAIDRQGRESPKSPTLWLEVR